MANQSIRMGHRRTDGGSPLKWLLAAGAAVAVVAGVFIYSMKSAPDRRSDGCLGDGDCRKGLLCADGGCIVLAADEIPDMWREDILRQTDPEKGGFSPRPAFGVKLLDADVCPGKQAPLKVEKGGAVTTHHEVTVYAFGLDHLKILQQRRAESSMWMDRMRFRFQHVGPESPPVYCHGGEVASLEVTPGKVENTVDALLTQAVPARAPAEASVMERRFIERDPSGRNPGKLLFATSPVRDRDRKEVSVVAFPLGTDILSMEGPPPTAQRLLTGYFAYYWKHGDKRQTVSISARLPKKLRNDLDFSQLNP